MSTARDPAERARAIRSREASGGSGGRDAALPPLDESERRAFEAGVAEFNSGRFFECHDTLEDLWTGIRGPSRDFLQGLIQVSVAFYHLTGGNLAGAESMIERALRRFQPYPDLYFGLDLAAHRVELGGWLERIRARDVGECRLADLPKWRFVPSRLHRG